MFKKSYYNTFDSLWRDFDAYFGEKDYTLAEKETGVELRIKAIGFTQEDIKVEANQKFLRIKAEKKETDAFIKSIDKEFSLYNADVDITKIDAKLENGILTIFIPYLDESKNKIQTINIK